MYTLNEDFVLQEAHERMARLRATRPLRRWRPSTTWVARRAR